MIGVARSGAWKPAVSSSSPESDEEELGLGDSDKDIDWGEITNGDVDAERLY
jgi:hypothetical protein